jgi:hypothetical protein
MDRTELAVEALVDALARYGDTETIRPSAPWVVAKTESARGIHSDGRGDQCPLVHRGQVGASAAHGYRRRPVSPS